MSGEAAGVGGRTLSTTSAPLVGLQEKKDLREGHKQEGKRSREGERRRWARVQCVVCGGRGGWGMRSLQSRIS